VNGRHRALTMQTTPINAADAPQPAGGCSQALEHTPVNREVRQQVLGAHAPALTVIISGIFDERWLIEIEAIAAA